MQRWADKIDCVQFDMRNYRSLDSRNVVVVVLLCRLFQAAGVKQFKCHHLPRKGVEVLSVLGLNELLNLPRVAGLDAELMA